MEEPLKMEEGLEIRAALVRVVIDGQELLGIVPTSDRFGASRRRSGGQAAASPSS
jgi:hypothetical protein